MDLRIYSESSSPSEENFLGQFIPLHYHFNMLQDEARVGAFRRAIELAVRPGMKVLELGGGTGILSYFAAQQGAFVRCVERNPEMVRTARRLLSRNLASGSVRVIEEDAAGYMPPEPVDVVICEMLHVAMLREKQLDVIEQFKQGYTEKFGDKLPRFVPESTLLAVQPIEHKFNFSGYHAPIPLFQAPEARHDQTRCLADLTAYASIFYDQTFPQRFRWSRNLRIDHSGTVTALRFVTHNLVGFEDSQTPVPWANQFLVLPVATPVTVAAGQKLRVSFDYVSGAPLSALADSISVYVKTDLMNRRRAA